MGIAVAMIFGGGGLAWWIVTGRHGRPRPGLQIGRVATSDGNEAAFVARSDRKVLVASVIGCLAIGAGMALMILGSGDALDLDALQTLSSHPSDSRRST